MKRIKNISLVFVFIASLFYSLLATAATPICTLLTAGKLLPVKTGVAVELEQKLYPESMKMVTTTDGTTGALLKQGETFPAWFIDVAKEKGKTPDKIKFDTLSTAMKIRLVKDVIAKRNESFAVTRSVYGLKTAESIDVTLAEPLSFGGRHYEAGQQKIQLRGFLEERVEISSPTQQYTQQFTGMELHVRQIGSAGQASRDAWALQDALGVNRTHQHVHIVTKIPLEKFKEQGNRFTFKFINFYTRANLVLEMRNIIEHGSLVRDKIKGNVTYFGYLKDLTVHSLFHQISEVGEGAFNGDDSAYKMAAVGFRPPTLYDRPDVWGLEVRAIGRASDPDSNQALLDAIQTKFESGGNYGISDKDIDGWLEFKGESEQSAAYRSWYNPSHADIDSGRKNRLAKSLGILIKDIPVRLATKYHGEMSLQYMLIYNWADDLIYYNKSITAVEKLKAAQRKALKLFAALEVTPFDLDVFKKKTAEIVSNFLLESDLYKHVAASLGIKVKIN